jgi:hypothetical protein
MMSATPQSILIADEQIVAAGVVLAHAFLNDPLCVYAQPDQEARLSQCTRLFTQLVQEGAAKGGAYTNTRIDPPGGVAV